MSKQKIIIRSYLPEKQKKEENISNLKMRLKNLNENNVFADLEDLKKLRRKQLAVQFINLYTKGEIKSKSEFIKKNKISIQTLNKGLNESGINFTSKKGIEKTVKNVKEESEEPLNSNINVEVVEKVRKNKMKKENSEKGGRHEYSKNHHEVTGLLEALKI